MSDTHCPPPCEVCGKDEVRCERQETMLDAAGRVVWMIGGDGESRPVMQSACDYSGHCSTYSPCLGINDTRCPKCGSTRNAHNRAYVAKVYAPRDAT